MFAFHFNGLSLGWHDVVDILLVTALLFGIITRIRGTRAVTAVLGLLALALLYVGAGLLGLYTITWLLQSFFASLLLVVVILFQQDIRMALSAIGTRRFWGKRKVISEALLDDLVDVSMELARNRVGALIVLERLMPLRDMMEREGVRLNARFSRELLQTIFAVNTPLHDGAVIISKGSITAAACILPLATARRQSFGTRHRAALGITEESDAVAIVVSEERGEVSVAIKGKLTKNLDAVRLKRVLGYVL
ncbi:MAG: diadenylate cyclase CdaA [Deltaproteobacteria bacterium]|nr:diadenylate cyclase CdaA [Deltaproteobacteria bacterium]